MTTRQARTAEILAVVAVGGVLGVLARYQAGLWWPPRSGRFDVTTLVVNLVGCLLIGIASTVIVDLRTHAHPLLRPFVVTGILGGFTTFSTYAAGAAALTDRPGLLLLSLLATAVAAPLACLFARWATLRIGRAGGRRVSTA